MSQTGAHSNKWYSPLLTPQGVIAVVSIISSVSIFWIKTQEAWNKINQLEQKLYEKADASSVRSIDDKVTRQYQVQREMNDKTNNEVEELKLWMEYHKGYEQSRKDNKHKP